MHAPNLGPPDSQGGRPWVLIGVLVSAILLLGNLLAYLWYVNRPAPKTEIVAVKDLPPPPVAPEPEPSGLADLARAQRKLGVESIKVGEYEKAINALEAAKTLDPELEEVSALLEVARKLKKAEVEEARRAREKRTEDDAPRSNERRRASRRNRRSASRASRDEAPAPGILIVTTEPDRVLVRLDGEPRDLTPARLEVAPGRHRLELYRGEKRVLSRDIEIASRRVTLLDEVIPRAPPPQAAPQPTVRPNVDEDGNLDLISLLDRSPVESPATNGARRTRQTGRQPPPSTPPSWFAPTTGPARIVVYRPGSSSREVQQALTGSMQGTDIEVVSKADELGRAGPVDAVIAPASVLRSVGLTPTLLADGATDYVLVSFEPMTDGATLAGKTIAAVAELERRAMRTRVAEILKLSEAPRVRRVPKVEDLLSTLQLKLADAALVRSENLALIKRRTRRRLYEKSFEASAANLAVAFVPGGRRSQVEPSIRGLGRAARSALGVAGWKR